MQASAQKFTFGDDFGVERRGSPARRAQDRAIAEEAEQRGYQAGFEAGLQAQQQSDASQLAHALAAIAAQLSSFERNQAAFFNACETEAVALVCMLAELHGDRVAGFDPQAGFAAAVHDVLTRFADASHLVARVPPALRDATEARLASLCAELRFNGRISVETLPAQAYHSDFALEWPDGALRFDRRALDEKLRHEFQKFGFLSDVTDHG